MNVLTLYPRPNDILWFRTIATGHEDCQNEQTTPIDPLANFSEYREIYQHRKDRWHYWDEFEGFNQYMEAEVIKINRDKTWAGPKIELFDVYWMTAMRRDGHPSDADCLHYLLPGPPDWWNHLFYSNLKELASILSQTKL